MEIKFKLGDLKIKVKDTDFFETFLSRPVMDYYQKFYEGMPQYMAGYYKEMSKLLAQFIETGRHEPGKVPEGSDIIPANGHDIYNYVGRYCKSNYHSQAILKFDGKLDYTRLKRAVRLTLDSEPVFASRFVEGNPPYWKLMDNIEGVEFCSIEEATDANQALQSFIESNLDMDRDPMVKLKLIRSAGGDLLGIKINHACCDGTGIKEYVQLLSDIYSNIGDQRDNFVPEARSRSRADQDRLFQSLGITNPDALWIPGSDISIPTWAFPWRQGTSETAGMVICKLAPEHLEKISVYSKAKGVTINDLILTAYYRSMLRMGQPVYGVPMGINVTIDLRRYLPGNKTEAIRNFSGSVNSWLTMLENESFADTLSRVQYMMNEIKNGYPGLQSAIGLERLEKISFKDTLFYYQASTKYSRKLKLAAFQGNRCIPALSNLGLLSRTLIKFGDSTVSEYSILPPIVSAPGLLLVANTYNSIMTLAAGYFENTVLREDISKLLYGIRDELLEGCRL